METKQTTANFSSKQITAQLVATESHESHNHLSTTPQRWPIEGTTLLIVSLTAEAMADLGELDQQGTIQAEAERLLKVKAAEILSETVENFRIEDSRLLITAPGKAFVWLEWSAMHIEPDSEDEAEAADEIDPLMGIIRRGGRTGEEYDPGEQMHYASEYDRTAPRED